MTEQGLLQSPTGEGRTSSSLPFSGLSLVIFYVLSAFYGLFYTFSKCQKKVDKTAKKTKRKAAGEVRSASLVSEKFSRKKGDFYGFMKITAFETIFGFEHNA